MSLPLAVALAELRSPLEKSYRNTVYCADALEQDESGTLKGRYCGNRWCLVCNRVRTARAINRYWAAIAAWPDAQGFTREQAAYDLPKTNPFLRKMFTYLAGPDLDTRIEWAVDDTNPPAAISARSRPGSGRSRGTATPDSNVRSALPAR